MEYDAEASVPMNKARVSAQQFLAALQGETVEYELDGVGTVLIRSMTTPEAELFATNDKEGNASKMFKAVELCLVEPALTLEEWAQLATAKPGPIMDLAKRIMELSGMATKANDLEGEAGGGS
jgi:hypothetical protein